MSTAEEITIITFNYGTAGKYVNGPGMCLKNFVQKLKLLGVKVNLFSELNPKDPEVKPLDDPALAKSIRRSKVLHHWSGLGKKYRPAYQVANRNGVKTILGPNVLDLVKFEEEKVFLKDLPYDKVLTVNSYLMKSISEGHFIPMEKIGLLRVGPDEELWAPIPDDNGKVLWKGNSQQFVKDVDFALRIQKRLSRYDFEFLGYPQPYHYRSHIETAKKAHLYFSTSLSETMGLTILESYCSGLPAITHPKIYLDHQNYQAGIITERNEDAYCRAIEEVMEDQDLYRGLSQGAQDYVAINFSGVAKDYLKQELR